MKKLWIGVVLAVMVVGLNSDSKKVVPVEVYATWLWNPWEMEGGEAEILAFLESRKVKKLYIQVDQEVPASVYQSFIEKASMQGVKAYALDGAPDWVSPSGYISQDELMAWIRTYQEVSNSMQRFSGIHLDVEPYLYSGWETEQKAAVHSYQELLSKAKAKADSLALPLEVDVPFWFDKISYENTFGSGILVEWVIANTDSITIMAYRDTAPLIIELVKSEMDYAADHGKKAVVGVETAPTDEGEALTFFEEGEAYMTGQLEKVQAHYRDAPGYGGIAVHHIESWKSMAP